MRFKYVILGAGPAGLAAGYRLLKHGESSFIILEKEATAGGLCRSVMVDGAPLDRGGGHFLDSRNKDACDFLFSFLPKSEWTHYKRISKIKLGNYLIDYPFELNLSQLPFHIRFRYLISYLHAILKKKKNSQTFENWVLATYGEQMAQDYLIPYNKKIWSINLKELDTSWLHKIPSVPPVKILSSLLGFTQKKVNLPSHPSFYYPKRFGYGEVWERIALSMKNHIQYNTLIKKIDIKSKTVNETYSGDVIINTIPWDIPVFSPQLPVTIQSAISALKHTTIRVSYLPKKIKTKAHWAYIPDQNTAHHREIYRSNFSKNAPGFWTETNEARSKMEQDHTKKYWINDYAYPLPTKKKQKSINLILQYFSQHGIHGVGRWGQWEHINSDITINRSFNLVDLLLS